MITRNYDEPTYQRANNNAMIFRGLEHDACLHVQKAPEGLIEHILRH